MVNTLQRFVLPFICIAIAAFAVFAVSPSDAHEGGSPHVGQAEYHGWNLVVFDKDADVSGGWHIPDVANHFDNVIQGPHPGTIRMGECESSPGKCIRFHEVHGADGNCARGERNGDSGPDDIWLNTEQCFGAGGGGIQAHTCRITALMFGLHNNHNGNAGCAKEGYTSANKWLGPGEQTALQNAYCPGVGCRGTAHEWRHADRAQHLVVLAARADARPCHRQAREIC